MRLAVFADAYSWIPGLDGTLFLLCWSLFGSVVVSTTGLNRHAAHTWTCVGLKFQLSHSSEASENEIETISRPKGFAEYTTTCEEKVGRPLFLVLVLVFRVRHAKCFVFAARCLVRLCSFCVASTGSGEDYPALDRDRLALSASRFCLLEKRHRGDFVEVVVVALDVFLFKCYPHAS